MSMILRIREGKRGRWRWFVRDGHEKFRAGSPPRGFASRAEAQADARALFGADMVINDPEEGELYAGPRDFE